MDELRSWQVDLQSPDVNKRIAAAEHLASAPTDAVAAAVELVRACADTEPVQQWAVAALESMPPPALQSQPQLADLTASPDSLVVYWAVTLLGRLESAASPSQPQLAKVLADSPDLSNRQRAAWALGKIGATAPEALAALKQAAGTSDPRLARLAQQALPATAG